MQDDFGIEQDDVYEVVGAWHDHAADVEEYVSIQEEYSLDAKGIREAAKQYVENKDELAQYRALRQDTGMDAEGMRKVCCTPSTVRRIICLHIFAGRYFGHKCSPAPS